MIRILPKRDLSVEVWRLAGPAVAGMVSQTLLNLVDTAMVGRLGAVALGAAGLGGIITWMVLGTLGAINVGGQAIAARRYGEGEFEKAGKTLDNTLFLAFIIGMLCSFLIAPLMRELYALFTNDPEVIVQGRQYIFYRLLGGLPFMFIAAYRGFFNGIGETRLHMWVSIIVNGSNILLNYLLIFGNFGFPRMETAGAGLASSLATLIGALVFVGIAMQSKWRSRYRLYRISNLDMAVTKTIIRLSASTGLQVLLVMLGFTLFGSIVAKLGTVQLAATHVCLSIMSFSYMPGAGIGIAASSLVGQKLGEGKPDLAETYGWEAGKNGMWMMGIIGIVFILNPEMIFRIFTDDPAVIQAGALPLRVMGFVQAFDGAGMVFTYSLFGAGLNRWVLFAEVGINWGIFLPLTFLFAKILNWGLTGAWMAFALYLVLFAVAVTSKFATGSWKTSRI